MILQNELRSLEGTVFFLSLANAHMTKIWLIQFGNWISSFCGKSLTTGSADDRSADLLPLRRAERLTLPVLFSEVPSLMVLWLGGNSILWFCHICPVVHALNHSCSWSGVEEKIFRKWQYSKLLCFDYERSWRRSKSFLCRLDKKERPAKGLCCTHGCI